MYSHISIQVHPLCNPVNSFLSPWKSTITVIFLNLYFSIHVYPLHNHFNPFLSLLQSTIATIFPNPNFLLVEMDRRKIGRDKISLSFSI